MSIADVNKIFSYMEWRERKYMHSLDCLDFICSGFFVFFKSAWHLYDSRFHLYLTHSFIKWWLLLRMRSVYTYFQPRLHLPLSCQCHSTAICTLLHTITVILYRLCCMANLLLWFRSCSLTQTNTHIYHLFSPVIPCRYLFVLLQEYPYTHWHLNVLCKQTCVDRRKRHLNYNLK